ncbi:MAG: IS5 family transposase [Phycisphaerales bacterium]
MRGERDRQGGMFYAIDLEARVRADHPLRPIKKMVDAELARMGHLFNKAYSATGRPGVPPEVLLKALLLQALYAIRSEAQLVERIDTDLLFRWFLDMDPAMDVFDPTAFTHNRPRLQEFGIIQRFFDGVVRRAMDEGLASDDHFSADGTLIRSYASLKSLKPIDPATGEFLQDGDDDDTPTGRNAPADFKGMRRSNATHRSTTDSEARLYRKGDGQPTYLYHSAHAITENRHGLIMAVGVDAADGHAERRACAALLDDLHERGVEPATLGADKGYDDGVFIQTLEARGIDPHVAIKKGRISLETDGGVIRWLCRAMSRYKDFKTSQRRRKMIEEGFGWIKDFAGLGRTRLVGRWKIAMQVMMTGAAYNLVRMVRLLAA